MHKGETEGNLRTAHSGILVHVQYLVLQMYTNSVLPYGKLTTNVLMVLDLEYVSCTVLYTVNTIIYSILINITYTL